MILNLDELLRVLHYIKDNGGSEFVEMTICDNRLNFEEYPSHNAGGNLYSIYVFGDDEIPF